MDGGSSERLGRWLRPLAGRSGARYVSAVADGEIARRQARDALISEALPLADRLARRYFGRGLADDDPRQVARLGLVKAVDNVDPDLGSFTAYAAATVRGELRRHFRDAGWDVHVARPIQELALAAWRAKEQLTQELSGAPTRREMTVRRGVPLSEVDLAAQAVLGYSFLTSHGPVQRWDNGLVRRSRRRLVR
ncbi:sigma-70 family RNA polymerase sigma factor [Asanoa sp. WMMD1127]|uniref:sigma-70 family RNA polymerase sigma factor n=1 Tax=Asanoa sp. WMMD1127 TaxID=3016107 RepID=UPI0024179131|nr:sigma-70 family RNA polymerase sigma factor [Asanoa sp. WMMD1127]MDG4824972.1 sigma-70 family RNA polymerase sigma factor [Asanoa sp. WMMD1127]